MRLLLDTHIFLWYVSGDQRVGARVRAVIENAETVLFERSLGVGGYDQVSHWQTSSSGTTPSMAVHAA
jgi:hypothetical protein